MTGPKPQSFSTEVVSGARKRPLVPVPFDPNEVWGHKSEHRVSGTIGEASWRGSIVAHEGGFALAPGPAWWRDCGVDPGTKVKVTLAPEGPQRGDLAPDLAAALESSPDAGAFFDGLAQFYRKAYLRYIDATKRKPELRAERIAEVVDLLRRGMKERPR